MATYNNRHWLLSHIRNSFISTDDTGMCETVMLSNDLPKQFLLQTQKCHHHQPLPTKQQQRRFDGLRKQSRLPPPKIIPNLCYPGLDQSDDEDLDLAESYDIQMYPEIGSHRFRSNTAQKLEKMDYVRRKASRTRNIKIDDNFYTNLNLNNNSINDLFQRKIVPKSLNKKNDDDDAVDDTICSRLTEQLKICPKPAQNKFIQYARFDGTSQTGIQTKTLNVFINMLPENQRNYPMKICVIASAKIEEVIGFICYKFTIQNPQIPLLQSVRHYGLFITEDNGEMFTEFPPLDLRQPCQKFEFNCLTLAERRPAALSITSEAESIRDEAVKDFRGSQLCNTNINNQQADDMERMLGHNSMIEAPLYRTYRLQIVVRSFFKSEIQLGISGERLEIDPVASKNSMFYRQKAISYNIDTIAYCEIIDNKIHKAILRIWYLNPYPLTTSNSSSMHFYPTDSSLFFKSHPLSHSSGGAAANCSNTDNTTIHHSSSLLSATTTTTATSSPQHFNFNFQNSLISPTTNRFKYYDFETDPNTAQQILNKMNFILDVRSSITRKEFLLYRDRKKERLSKKSLLQHKS